jgi:7-carboxy-7-deazaguanine synthase
MKISEIFYSIQGEGKLAGVPSVFVRASGCNLRCTWCDTPYASWNPKGEEMSVGEILERVVEYKARHVVLTGGEPMMFRQLPELIRGLKERGMHVTVETAGTLWLEGIVEGGIDLASVSPKLANSTPWEREGGRFAQVHERHRLNVEVLRTMARGGGGVVREVQWKFVVSSREDLVEIERVLDSIGSVEKDDVLLMPEGTDVGTLSERSRWVSEICKERGYRFCPRLHVYLYGNTKGT